MGLSSSQTKVYLALATLGKATGKTVWKCSGVARQDIYRVLAELLDKGLVEKTISRPTEFKAVPMYQGIDLLLTRKNNEYKKIEEETKKLLQRIRENQEKENPFEDKEQFYLVPAKDAAWQTIKKSVTNAKKTIDAVFSWKQFLQLTTTQEDDIAESIKRGVKYRWVVDKPEKESNLPCVARTYLESDSCQFKIGIPNSPEAALAIFDQNEVLVSTESQMPFYLDSAILWSNNASFVGSMQHYFSLMWEKAQKFKV